MEEKDLGSGHINDLANAPDQRSTELLLAYYVMKQQLQWNTVLQRRVGDEIFVFVYAAKSRSEIYPLLERYAESELIFDWMDVAWINRGIREQRREFKPGKCIGSSYS